MGKNYIFSSESVGEGHPDKVSDTISDAVLDACLAQDKFSRVACETYVKSNIAIIGGEITTKAKLDFVQIARDAIREIGYRGWIVLETSSPSKDAVADAKRNGAYVRSLFA